MKQADKTVERLLQIGDDIGKNKRNVRNAMAEVNAIEVAGRIAFYHSNHQRFQRRIPKVKFFDAEAPKPAVVEEQPKTRISGTLTINNGAKPKKVRVSSK
jgi:hypothetical protein